MDIGKLGLGPERLQGCEDFQKILAAHRFDNEALAIAMDHHAVTGKLEIGRDAQRLALVVPEQFGFSRRSGIGLFPGHIDLLCIYLSICITPEECQDFRSEEQTSELQSLMRISYAVFCLQKKKKTQKNKDQ